MGTLRVRLVLLVAVALVPAIALTFNVRLPSSFIAAVLAVSALSLGAVWLFSDLYITRRARALADAIRRFASGDLAPAPGISLGGDDELDEIGKALGELRESLGRKAEEAVEGEKKYRSLVEEVPAVMYVTDGEGKPTFVSPQVERILGHSPEDWIRDAAVRAVHPDDAAAASRAGRTVPYSIEYRLKSKDGRWLWVRDRGVPVVTDGRISHYRGFLADVTDRKRLEEQLRQAQKMEAVGRLAGGVAHDFNNILTVVNAYSDMLLSGRLAPNDASKVKEIRNAGERAAALTRQLVSFSSRQVVQPIPLNLDACLAATEPILRRLLPEHVELVRRPSSPLGTILADPAQIEQVVLNLVLNARDALPGGGRITLETADVLVDESYARLNVDVRPGPWVQLSVADNGIGMDAETRAHAFEPFFTTKPAGKGTGLGLATVYGIVRQAGGHITCASEPSRGTVFKIIFPRVDSPAITSLNPRTPLPSAPTGSETVLLLEDETPVRELMRGILTVHGYRVLEAKDGPEALRISGAFEGKIDLLLSDSVMPQMSGPEVANRLTAVRKDLRVMFVSGYTEEGVVDGGVVRPGMTFLQKPFSAEELVRRVRQTLDRV